MTTVPPHARTAHPSSPSRPWFLYLLECRDGSIYTGIAVDVAQRFTEHQAGKGARYTRSHPPVRLLATREYPDRSTASRAEAALKRKTATAKRAFAADPTATVVFIDRKPRRSRARTAPGAPSPKTRETGPATPGKSPRGPK